MWSLDDFEFGAHWDELYKEHEKRRIEIYEKYKNLIHTIILGDIIEDDTGKAIRVVELIRSKEMPPYYYLYGQSLKKNFNDYKSAQARQINIDKVKKINGVNVEDHLSKFKGPGRMDV